MLRPNPSGAPVPSLDDVKCRPLSMSLLPAAGLERRDLRRREAVVRRIVAEFQDMPGLVLSLKQASRFLGVDQAACARILTMLTERGVLSRSTSEYYSRREPGR
jgi:DNA-binding MarR family transcriptional regulator